ncbi:hypothetical protein E4T81_12450 [Barnesiella sp. WM24]|uniref:hypothetical protein n=1 Tax=Barnesiella sp. WM24 TaxID=2558278 RepID=UPI001072C495|nr:hypothetical protein [Barnesiella sp. WM24]TFU92393.1 hypothetical protein E4T81_12450 [Barnesiella sp. WM24]
MYEELYIIDNGQRFKVDLSMPSGITLNFASNIFGDLSKITCSRTYTFRLPMTANNRRILNNADDIRCISSKIRRRLKAEYMQNGIPLFSNANLYIDSTETCFNAVMTWGVIDGFQALKDNDISIRELPLEAKPIFGPCNAKIGDYKNTLNYVQPLYNAGLPYISEGGNKNIYNTYSFFPLPAIPVYRLIELINTQFGTKFNLGKAYVYGEEADTHDIIKMGVIPAINVSDEEEKEIASLLMGFVNGQSINGIGNVIVSPTNAFGTVDANFLRVNKNDAGSVISITNISKSALEIDADSQFCANFMWRPDRYDWDVTLNESAGSSPKLSFFIDTNEVAGIEGKYGVSSSGILCWVFDFSQKNGKDRLTFTLPSGATVFMAFTCGLNRFSVSGILENSYTRLYSTYSIDSIKWNETESEAGSMPMDLMSNLPDISCLTLMKSLFFMMGAFPTINNANEIIPVFYTDIRGKLLAGNSLDWSSKITSEYATLPSKTTYSVNGFGQNNYYIMKNDNVDSDADEDETDVYESGIGIIRVQNEVIEKNKTIIQLPFYAPYIKNKKDPKRQTGDTMKFWYVENDEVKTKEAKPCFGMIKPFIQYSSPGTPTGIIWMGMEVWNDFPRINNDSSYSYLSKIMENPVIISENLRLNEHDLRILDYSTPVYLSKYCAFFAIVTITRDSKGICKCELLKLPEEE